MWPNVDPTVPVVVVYNNLEAFSRFAGRAGDTSVVRPRMYRGDRSLLWLGDPKLVFVTVPVPHLDELNRRWGYHGTCCVAPERPSLSLSFDILNRPELVERIVAHAGTGRTVQMVPYATTRAFLALAEALRRHCRLTVLLPESPAAEALWLRDYIDSKSGFRALASRWLPDADTLLPEGFVCGDLRQAADVAYWFSRQGRACIVKPDLGESGLGQVVLEPDVWGDADHIVERLQTNLFLHYPPIVVEELIHAEWPASPSLECFVPPVGQGVPEITYLSNQLFLGFGNFDGVQIDRSLYDAPWFPALARSGLAMAKALQALGYVGHFDLDSVVDDEGQIRLLEINSRRTGGTHVHEFARFQFGPDYLDKVVLICHNKLRSRGISGYDELMAKLDDLLFPMKGERRGVVLSLTSGLVYGEIGCIVVAETIEDALEIQGTLQTRLSAPLRAVERVLYDALT